MRLGEALGALGWSDRQAGSRVRAVWKRHEQRADYPEAEAIAAKIGLLKKGDERWWRNRPHAIAALAELLRCTPEELLPSGRSTAGAVDFVEFRELAPLLPGQDPCIVGPTGWVGAIARDAAQQGGRAWIQVPPGGGKSLAIRVLGQGRHGGSATTTARALHEMLRSSDPGVPIVAEIECVEPATDAAAMAEIARRQAGVCILASFIPSRRWLGGWHVAPGWQPAEDWRERLVRWAQLRVAKPEQLDAEDVLEWLGILDPDGTIFSTPGELLPLLARTYRSGLPRRSEGLAGLAREWLTQTLSAAQDPWLRRFGRSAVESMVRGRLARLDVPLAPQPIHTWASVLPGNLTPAPDDGPRAKSKRAPAKSEAPSAAGPLQAMHLLADAGLLRTRDGGGLDVFPSWVRVGLEREAVMRSVKSSKGKEWALLAVDASRRPEVDRALDALSPSDLVLATRDALGGRDDDLPSVAAIESLFVAVGRLLAKGDWKPAPDQIPTLQQLGQRQLRLLELAPQVANGRPLLPLTRHLPGFDKSVYAEWFAAAWTFSFEVPVPAPVPAAGWYLPGWAPHLLLSEIPRALPWPTKEWLESPALWKLWEAARRAVGACLDHEVPDDVHHLLLPWVVIDSEAHGWTLGSSIGRTLLNSGMGKVVGVLLLAESAEVRVRTAAAVWPSIATMEDHPLYALWRLRQEQSPLFDVVAADVPLHLVDGTFAAADLTQGVADAGKIIASLPERLRRPMLHAAARQLRSSGVPPLGTGLEHVVAYVGREDLDLLVDFVTAKYQLGINAAQRVWLLDPDRATAEARRALELEDPAASNLWFYGAPVEHRVGLLDLLTAHAKPVSWANHWLADVLPLAGPSAPRVFAMMRSASPAPATS